MDRTHFFERLYPLQDEVLGVLSATETVFEAFLADLRRLGEELALLPPPR